MAKRALFSEVRPRLKGQEERSRRGLLPWAERRPHARPGEAARLRPLRLLGSQASCEGLLGSESVLCRAEAGKRLPAGHSGL